MRDRSADVLAALQRVRERHGKLTPQVILEEASTPSHPLHDRFEWDDSIAGHKYRLEQARGLIVSMKVVYRDPAGRAQEVRKFHAVRGADGYAYDPVEEIVQDEVAVKILLADMEREWRAMKQRYDQFEEFRVMVLRDLSGHVA